jgi:putative flippase GtrA
MERNDVSVIIPKLFIYAGIGVLNTVIDFIVFVSLSSGLGYHAVPSNIISYGTGTVLSFIMNQKYSFSAAHYHLGIHHRFLRFGAVNLVSLAISTTLVAFFSQSLFPVLAKILSIPFVLMWGFLASRAFVFTAAIPSVRE